MHHRMVNGNVREGCLACRLNVDPSGVPGGRIKEYARWFLEHMIPPLPIVGWLILKTKRHAEGIAGLNCAEAGELGEILERVPKVQQQILRVEKIYVCCFTELIGHLHFHLIPQPREKKYRGPEVFGIQQLVEEGKSKPVPEDSVVRFVQRLREKL